MRVFYTPRYYTDIGEGHVFPIRKFERVRDEFVLTECLNSRIPIVTVMSGGYASDINDTVEIHSNTIRAVRAKFRHAGASAGD